MSSPDLFESLKSVVVKRKTGDGEFSYVYLPSGEAVMGKKTAFKVLKSDEAFYESLKECKLDEESDASFDARVLKLLISVPFEGDVVVETSQHQTTKKPTAASAPAKCETKKILTDTGMKKDLVSKTQLSKLVARRRLEGGEFTYIYIPLEKAISGKKAMYNYLKNQSEFSKLKAACKDSSETDEEFDSRLMKEMLTVPYEKEIIPSAVDSEADFDLPSSKRKSFGSTSSVNENKKPRFASDDVKYVYFEAEVLRTYRSKANVPEPLHVVQFGAFDDSRESCFKALASKKINGVSENILEKLSLVKSGPFKLVYKRPKKSEVACIKEHLALEELFSFLEKLKGDSKLCLVTYRKESLRSLTGLIDVMTMRNKFRKSVDSMVILEEVFQKKPLKQFLPLGTLSSLYHKTVGHQSQLKCPSSEELAELLMKCCNILMKKYKFELKDFSVGIETVEGWNHFRKGLAYDLADPVFTVTNSNNFLNQEKYLDNENGGDTTKASTSTASGKDVGGESEEIIEMEIEEEENFDFSTVGQEMVYQVLCQPVLVKLGSVEENTKFVKFSLSSKMAGRARANKWEMLKDSAKVFWKNDLPYAFCNICPDIDNEVRYKPVKAKIVETILNNTNIGTYKALNRTDEEQRNLSTKVLLDIVVSQAGNVNKELTAVLVKLRLQPGSLTAGDEEQFELRSSDILICHQSTIKGVTIVSKFISVDRKQMVANRAKIIVKSSSHHLLGEGEVLGTATLFQNDVKLVFQTLDKQMETNSALQNSPSCAVMQVRNKQRRPLLTMGSSRLYAQGVNPVLVKLAQYEATRLTSKFAKAYVSYSSEFDEIIDQNRELLKIEKLTAKEAAVRVFWKKNIPYAFININIPYMKHQSKVDFCDIVQNYEIGSYAPFEHGEPKPSTKITMQLCVDFEEKNVMVDNIPRIVKVYLKFKDAEIDKKEVLEQYFAVEKAHRKKIDILSVVIRPDPASRLAPQKTSTNDMKAALLVRSVDDEPVLLTAREVIADCESLDPDTNINK